MRSATLLLTILLLPGCFPGQAADGGFVAAARSVDVVDGDSLVIKQGRHEQEIRLHGIDAPEHRQPWSSQSRAALSKLVSGYDLRIEAVEQDRFERTVARVYRVDDGLFVNAALVGAGHAWVYRRYSNDADLIARETAARRAGIGLWQLPAAQRVAPWDYRQRERR